MFPDYHWYWPLSLNPNFTPDFLVNKLDYNELSSNPNIDLEFVNNSIDKIELEDFVRKSKNI